jgi:phosphoglycerate dehydrogenase-like enzyme
MLPKKEDIEICFAHVAYQLGARFAARNTGIRYGQASNRDELNGQIASADVLVISGLWTNELLSSAKNLKFIQSIGAGTDQFPREQLAAQGIRLASARGVNMRAVSEHAMSLILAMSRRLPEARDNQQKKIWRGMISDLAQREDELGGKTLIVIGLGSIGSRLAQLAKVFGMNVIGLKRDPSQGGKEADSVHGMAGLKKLLPLADFVALTCPLTPETENVIGTDELALMKSSSYLINVARGRCVDEAALIAALQKKQIAGAALDVTAEEPLPASSPLWTMANVFITPHTAGETRKYEDNVLDILMDNLDRLWRGEKVLRNRIV